MNNPLQLPPEISVLIEGFRRFQKHYFSSIFEKISLFSELKHAQQPKILLIGCSDSRVDPALLLGATPGELFVVRNVANLVPPCESGSSYHGVSAAIQFAVLFLQVHHIIVLGHANCGGIHALLENEYTQPSDDDFIGRWIHIASPALTKTQHLPKAARLHACEQASILVSIDNLLTFPWIKSRVTEEKLSLHAWYFDLTQGALLAYSDHSQSFVPLVSSLSDTSI